MSEAPIRPWSDAEVVKVDALLRIIRDTAPPVDERGHDVELGKNMERVREGAIATLRAFLQTHQAGISFSGRRF